MSLQFQIYSFTFVRAKDADMFSTATGGGGTPATPPQELLAQWLADGGLYLQDTGSSASYPTQTHRDYGGIKLMSVDNKLKVTIFRNHRKVKEDSSPFCYVIIDNRQGCAHVAVQDKAPSFRMKPDKVVAVIQNSINARFAAGSGWRIDIRPVKQAAKLWDMVERKQRRGVGVKKVTFDFPNPRSVVVPSATERQRHNITELARMMNMMNATSLKQTYAADSHSCLRLERTMEDVNAMMTLCLTNGYSVSVSFTDKTTYRSGEDMTLTLEMGQDTFDDFINGEQTLGKPFALVDWLDTINAISQNGTAETDTRREG